MEEMASPVNHPRDWSELPLDALASIFGKLGAIEILMGAGLVCRTWLAAAKLPDLWRSVDMARHKVVVEIEEARQAWSMEPKINGDVLCAMARVAVDQSGGQMEVFEGKLFVTDQLLKYIADRSPALNAVRLTSCDGISNKGFTELVSKCPMLQVIELLLCQHVGGRGLYESAGMACAQLKRFALRNAPPFIVVGQSCGEALGVAAMHELRSLTLGNSDVTNDELVAILHGCPHLEILDLHDDCFNIVADDALKARCAGIKSLKLPCNHVPVMQEEEYDEKLSSRDVDGDYWDYD